MGLLAALDRQIKNATYNDREGWFADWLRGDETDSGATVNEQTAMKLSTVWKCVNWRARMFGMLPKKLFERVDILGRSAQKEAPQHPLFNLVHISPNPTITSCAWFGLISADLHLWGNSYAYIERGQRSGRIMCLWRIQPDKVRLDQDSQKQNWYMIQDATGVEQKFYPEEILHIRGLGFDGWRGYSPIQLQKQALGWVKATRQFSAKFYKNAFRPSGLLVAPAAIKEPAKSELLRALKESGKEGGLALIEGALEYKPLGIPQDDAQFIQTMEYQDTDICGIMEVKPHEISLMKHMTNNNVESETISSVTRCLQPFAVNVEQWFDLQLLSDLPSSGRGGGTERDRFFMQCELKVLLRGDTAAQTAHIEKMLDKGVYSDNDARDYLGLAPYDGGDRYWINSAYVPIDRIDEIVDKQVAPDPAPAAPAPDQTQQPNPNAAPAKKALGPILRDAIGRVINRPVKDRERVAAAILRPSLTALADLSEKSDPEFITGYLGAMVQRSTVWKESSVENIVTEELDRAVTAFMEGRQ